MKITDEAEQKVAHQLFDREWVPGDWRWDEYPQPNRWQLLARQLLEAALPHLEGATPRATPESLVEHQRHGSPDPGCAWCPEVPAASREGATPAIDRDVLRATERQQIAQSIRAEAVDEAVDGFIPIATLIRICEEAGR